MTRLASRLFSGSCAALFVIAVAGCISAPAADPTNLNPRSLPEMQQAGQVPGKDSDRPMVGLVLGGGGLRGFAHLGVLRALEEAGIRADIVVGASAGAVVGAAYASGMTPAQIESIARDVDLSSLVDWTVSSRGLMRGNRLAGWIDAITARVPIERFPVRFAAVATDLQSGMAVALDRGSAGAAIRASAAVPGMTVPVAHANGELVDGGVSSLVPVRFARAMGADVVIAVDIYCHGPRGDGLGVPSIVQRVMKTQSCLVAAPEMAEADLLIAPAITVKGISAKQEQEQAIRVGYEAARTALAAAGMANDGGWSILKQTRAHPRGQS